MMQSRSRPGLGIALYFGAMFAAGLYFTFAAVQGDYGLFREAEIRAEAQTLQAELEALTHQVAVMDNKTRRLSDSFLDLDLLDEQARDVLGLIRHDEIVVR